MDKKSSNSLNLSRLGGGGGSYISPVTHAEHSLLLLPEGTPAAEGTLQNDHRGGGKLGGHNQSPVLTALHLKGLLQNHLQRLRAQIHSIESEASRLEYELSAITTGSSPTQTTISLPALLRQLSETNWIDGKPLIREKRDWYFALRALSQRGLIHQDRYTQFCQLVSSASVPADILPSRSGLCQTASSFGQFRLQISEWKCPAGMQESVFLRVKAVSETFLGWLMAC